MVEEGRLKKKKPLSSAFDTHQIDSECVWDFLELNFTFLWWSFMVMGKERQIITRSKSRRCQKRKKLVGWWRRKWDYQALGSSSQEEMLYYVYISTLIRLVRRQMSWERWDRRPSERDTLVWIHICDAMPFDSIQSTLYEERWWSSGYFIFFRFQGWMGFLERSSSMRQACLKSFFEIEAWKEQTALKVEQSLLQPLATLC